MYPVIADHLFPRDQAAVNAPNATHMFSQDVKLPNTPCEKCVLQVIQFMTMHTPPCSYYHCAMVSLKGDPVADAADATSGGTTGGSAGGGGAGPVAAASAGAGGMGGMTLASGAIGSPQAGAAAPAMIAMPTPAPAAMGSAGMIAAAPVTAPPLNMTPAASTVPALPAAPQSGAKQGCSADGSPAPAGGAALALLALLALRRRRTTLYSR
jgi:MYXO-CTERM domain-containing protein